jgi:hypothetical protein
VDDWAPPMGPAKFGIPASAPVSHTPTALASTVTPSERVQAAGKLISRENPYTALMVIGALTFGLMAFSTSVRVGHTSASLNVGSTT